METDLKKLTFNYFRIFPAEVHKTSKSAKYNSVLKYFWQHVLKKTLSPLWNNIVFFPREISSCVLNTRMGMR